MSSLSDNTCLAGVSTADRAYFDGCLSGRRVDS